MSNSVTVTYYGVEGTGRTVTEAKKDAGRKIEESLTGTYKPQLIESRGTAIVIWRDPHGWHSNFVCESGKFRDQRTAFQGYSSGDRDYWDCYASAILSLGQQTWDGVEDVPPCLAEIDSLAKWARNDNTGRRIISDFKHWRGFQLAYRHKKAASPELAEHEWHQWACHNASEFANNKPESK